ncbi:MAG: type IV pilus modification protein PilV [Thiolinea sp.]
MTVHSLQRQSGLNLVEILVAALILSVGLLSLAGLQVASLKSTQNATQKQQASFMIHELFERMRANREAVIDGDYNTAGVSCSGTVPDCMGGTACSAAQIAVYDLYTVQCGENTASATNSGAGTQLLDGNFTVNCVGTNCSVSFNWTERVAEKNLETVNDSGEAAELTEESQTMSIDAVI